MDVFDRSCAGARQLQTQAKILPDISNYSNPPSVDAWFPKSGVLAYGKATAKSLGTMFVLYLLEPRNM
jgi:hypothetical protein